MWGLLPLLGESPLKGPLYRFEEKEDAFSCMRRLVLLAVNQEGCL